MNTRWSPVHLVIYILGLLSLLATGGIIALAASGHTVPSTLETVAVASLTGLAGVLAPNTGLVQPGGRRATDPPAAAVAPPGEPI